MIFNFCSLVMFVGSNWEAFRWASPARPASSAAGSGRRLFPAGHSGRRVLADGGKGLGGRGVSGAVVGRAVEARMAHGDEEPTSGRVLLDGFRAAGGVAELALAAGISEKVGRDHGGLLSSGFCLSQHH